MPMPARNVGTVVRWSGDYGFVRTDNGGEFFIGHRDLLRYGIRRVAVGQRLLFDPARDGLGRAPRAVNIRVVV